MQTADVERRALTPCATYGLWLAAAAQLFAATSTAQIILPAVHTSFGDTVTVTAYQRVSFKPDPAFAAAGNWQVRVIQASKKVLLTWAVDVGTAGDTCVTFGAHVFTVTAPDRGQVWVSWAPGEEWLRKSRGRPVATNYFVIIERRLPGDRSGISAPLRILRSAIPTYVSYGTDLTIKPPNADERQYIVSVEGGPPPGLRLQCLRVSVQTVSEVTIPELLACAPVEQDYGKYAQ